MEEVKRMKHAKYQKMYAETYRKDMDYVVIGDFYIGPFITKESAINSARLINEINNTTKPKTRTKYVRVHQSEAVKSVLEGSRDYWCKSGESWVSLSMSSPLEEFCRAFKKVEKEIDWRDITADWVQQNQSVLIDFSDEIVTYHYGSVSCGVFLNMCRTALRATGELE